MVERRDNDRFIADLRVNFATTEFFSNVSVDAYLIDCSRTGARLVSPVYFEPNSAVKICVETLKDAIEILGKIVSCREDSHQTHRFDKTYAVHVQFETIDDNTWAGLLAMGKK